MLVVSIIYKNEKPIDLIMKIVELFDNTNEVDLNSDDFTTEFVSPNGEKHFAINFPYKTSDFKTAVYETLIKANRIGKGWTVQGPKKAKINFFTMDLKDNGSNILPPGILRYQIILNSQQDNK